MNEHCPACAGRVDIGDHGLGPECPGVAARPASGLPRESFLCGWCGDVNTLDELRGHLYAEGRVIPPEAARPVSGLEALDRSITPPHREDEPCACGDCMAYGAEDAGADWYRIPPANRIVMRILDSGDDRLAALRQAFIDHEAALSEEPATRSELDVDLENRMRRIVERTSVMGPCSQTHHEHLWRDAQKVYAAALSPTPEADQ